MVCDMKLTCSEYKINSARCSMFASKCYAYSERVQNVIKDIIKRECEACDKPYKCHHLLEDKVVVSDSALERLKEHRKKFPINLEYPKLRWYVNAIEEWKIELNHLMKELDNS